MIPYYIHSKKIAISIWKDQYYFHRGFWKKIPVYGAAGRGYTSQAIILQSLQY
jgi:hypothetical protein